METPKYKRVIIKLSGEALAGDQGFGLENSVLDSLAEQIGDIIAMGVERYRSRHC